MIKGIWNFFHGLRGKLTLTYTLVTVLALLALEVLVILLISLASSILRVDVQNYLGDVVITMYPQAREYLQPGAEDLPGLQAWLDGVAASGYASLEPQGWGDSPAARIVPGQPVYVLSPDGTVLAQSPSEPNNLVGRSYTPPDIPPQAEKVLERALNGDRIPLRIAARTPQGSYYMAVPIRQAEWDTSLVGVMIVTVEEPSPLILSIWPVLVGWVLITGAILLMGVAPFGALFGFIMSRGLTRRLKVLSSAADAWSEGDFQVFPQDHSKDEIGDLGLRLRHMAERIQSLLQSQQELAMLEERNRLARELHDTVKQQSFATLMQVRAARNLLHSDPQTAEAHLREAESLIKTSQQELGGMIAELRPAALDGQGLAEALKAYLQSWSQRAHIPADLKVQNQRLLPLEAEQALYRVAQEALSNVARHSRASAVNVLLDYQPQQVRLVVTDNGVGFVPDASAAGFGLHSMRDRVSALGGQLDVQSTSEDGTTVAALVPAP